MERMKQLTVCIDDGLQGEVVYRAEISHTEEDYQELKSDLEFVREENRKLKELKCIPTNLEKAIRIDKENEILEEENQKLKEENKELKDAMKELNNYNKFRIQENERLKKENEELQE